MSTTHKDTRQAPFTKRKEREPGACRNNVNFSKQIMRCTNIKETAKVYVSKYLTRVNKRLLKIFGTTTKIFQCCPCKIFLRYILLSRSSLNYCTTNKLILTMEKWFTIEPIKGYVCKSDFEKFEKVIKQNYSYKAKLFKKQKFVLVVICTDYYINTYDIYKLLVGLNYKKAYELSKMTDNRGRRIANNFPKRTIGLPY